MGWVQPGTRRGTFLQMIGSRKIDAAQDIADGAVGRFIHLLEAEFLNPGFIRGDGSAFDADAVLLDGFRRVDGDLVVGFVAFLDAEIVIFEFDVEIGQDQFLFDEIPDNAGHLIAIELDDRIGNLDLVHKYFPEFAGFWRPS